MVNLKFFQIILLFVLFIGISKGYIIHYTEQHHNEVRPIDEDGYIECVCNGRNVKEDLPKDSLDKVFLDIRNHNFCNENHRSSICTLMEECQSCSAQIEKCILDTKTSNYYNCMRKRFVMRDNHFVSIRDEPEYGKGRVARHAPSCPYPTNLKTADLICVKYPSSIKCRQKCIFGYTLREGISREMKCDYSKNQWNPIGFEECRPFVDCSMSLVSTGKLDCVTGTTKAAPACNVSCEHYEDKAAVPKKTYECKITGSWSKKLPFCAVPGSGLDLVPAPRIKLHPLKNN